MNVLISRTDAIGDTVLTLPMASMLKDKIPGVQVVFLIDKISTDLLKNHPYVDRFIVYDKSMSTFNKMIFLYKEYRKNKIDIFFYVGGSHLPSFLAKLMRIPFRGGLKSKWPTFLLLNKGIRQKRSLVEGHETEYNLNLLSPLNIEYNFLMREKYHPEINLSIDEVDSAIGEFYVDLKADGYAIDKKMVFIHPGMSGHTLNWPSRNYGRLIERLSHHFGDEFLFIISFTPSDEAFLTGMKEYLKHNVTAELKKRIYYFDGSIKGLRNYMAILKQAELFIGPSTGTTHLANCLGVKLISIYSPIKVQSSLRWGPFFRNEKTQIIVPDVICGQHYHCIGNECPYFECMAKIEVEDVVKKVTLLLELKA